MAICKICQKNLGNVHTTTVVIHQSKDKPCRKIKGLNKEIDLFYFIGDLKGLLNALESIDRPWKDDFQSEINILEMLHDSIEDGSISKWKGDPKEDMDKSIAKLKNITTTLIEE